MKKKYLFIVIIPVLLIIFITISLLLQPKSGTMICTYKSKSGTLDVDMLYQINFSNKMVTSLKARETITSDDKKMLEEYKDTLNMVYSIYNDLDYYDVEVLIKDKTLITNALINYKKIDKDKFIEIDPNNKNLYEGNKVPLSRLKNKYKNNGAKCRYA